MAYSDSDRGEIREAALRFLAATFAQLKTPPSVTLPGFHPYLRAGRESYWSSLTALREYKRLESALNKANPRLFSSRAGTEFVTASSIISSFLAAVIWRHSASGQNLDPQSPTTAACLQELVAAASTDQCRVACCRLVSHVTTSDGSTVEIGDYAISPMRDDVEVAMAVRQVIPSVAYAPPTELPHAFDPPHALIVVRDRGRNRFDTAAKLSRRLERLMLLLRLLYGGTLESFYEVSGETGLVCRHAPNVALFRRGTLGAIRRTIRLTAADAGPVAALDAMLDSLGTDRTDVVVTSLDMALWKFSESYLGTPWFDQLVDVCTALEAALSGQDKDDVLLRLRSRTATLLATEQDSAEAIFADVGELYGLRSTLVHGGSVPVKSAEKTFRRLSTFRSGLPASVALAFAVDRLRDLVRRATLARMALASGAEPLWPLDGKVSVDAILADDHKRQQWRAAWREQLASMGAERAADRASDAVDSFSREDRMSP